MSHLVWEILLVFALTLLQGFFAGSEIALISIRRTRVAQLVRRGSRKARLIQNLQNAPEKLFATAQIGISLLTIFASAFAGTSLAEALGNFWQGSSISFVALNAHLLSFTLVVVIVTYFTLVLGELVPKSLAIRYPENFAMLTARPIWWISKMLYWAIRFLNFSSNIILKPFNDSTNFAESRISEEEIRALIYEGKQAGTIAAREHEILQNVFELSDTPVAKVMTPRKKIIAFDIEESPLTCIPKIIEAGYTRVPFYHGSLDNILGILHVKDILPFFGQGFSEVNLKKLLLPVFFVTSTQKTSEVLQHFLKKNVHQAMVKNPNGTIEGLVTLEDVLEEIVGEIVDEDDEKIKETT